MAIILNGTTGITDVNGTAAAPALTGTDTDTGIFFPAANTLAFATNGTEDARFDASGNLLLGTTAAPTSSAKIKIATATRTAAFFDLTATGGENWIIDSTNTASSTDVLGIYAYGATGLYIQDSGNVGIGTTSPSEKLQVAGSIRVTSNASNFNTTGGQVDFITDTTRIAAYNSTGGFVTFYTNASGGNVAEKVRLDPGGNFQVGLTNIASYVGSSPVGSIANVASANATNSAAFVHSTTGVPYGPFFYFSGASPNNTTSYFLQCTDTTNSKAFIYSNGTFGSRTSTYGGISDIKVKQDIVDASSQWDDIKALRFRKYRFKDDPTGPLQLGLISQEAELVSPGLVFETPDTTMDEEGNRVETGEVTKSVKYSILYMKAMVALQEAMNRIEQLEADVAALKA